MCGKENTAKAIAINSILLALYAQLEKFLLEMMFYGCGLQSTFSTVCVPFI